MELSTNYMGLRFATRSCVRLAAFHTSTACSGSPMLESARWCCYSLFEEQVREEAAQTPARRRRHRELRRVAVLLPGGAEEDCGPTVSEPAGARRRSGRRAGDRQSQRRHSGRLDRLRARDAGRRRRRDRAEHLLPPGDASTPGREVEQRHVDVLERVKDAVTVPVAVKLGPYFSSTGEMALRLDEAGADALVLFNRFLQPDIDTEQLAVVRPRLSSPATPGWRAPGSRCFAGRVTPRSRPPPASRSPADLAKYLLAGADV